MTYRIGSVPYLNSKPLIWGLDVDPEVRLTLRPSARLTPHFVREKLDAALIPSIEILRRGFEVVPGLAVASNGPARSVLLHHRVPFREIRAVALDRNSRTTNALARILLERRFGLKPRYVTGDPFNGLFHHDSRVDAAVTIGDLSFRRAEWPARDLGQEWKEFAGVPFVYALWALRRQDAGLARRLQRAAREGLMHLDDVVDREHVRVGLSRNACRAYLTDNIVFSFGLRERQGLALFEHHCRELNLLP
ncbi:MAG: menaquinone biosynthesis protein [Planctomycetes bacterium]|nr:menaquinone biosynthesis protein [Planctomycetota bacterium]